MVFVLLMVVIVGYLLGSVNSALIYARLSGRDDIRSRGSGNAGAANMLRIHGKAAGLITAAGDLLKAVVAVLLARAFFDLAMRQPDFDPGYIAGLAVLIGHIYPVFFRFKGGKGVMPAVGFILITDPLAFVILLAIAVAVFLLFRTISIVSLAGAALLPLITWALGLLRGADTLFSVLITLACAVLVFWAHRANIARIIKGTEPRIRSGNAAKPGA